jgi:hypothetical protein
VDEQFAWCEGELFRDLSTPPKFYRITGIGKENFLALDEEGKEVGPFSIQRLHEWTLIDEVTLYRYTYKILGKEVYPEISQTKWRSEKWVGDPNTKLLKTESKTISFESDMEV